MPWCNCGHYITDTQARMSSMRADGAKPACRDCVTGERTRAACEADHKKVCTRCATCGWCPTHFRVVGWFSFDPLDTSKAPFSLECRVETNNNRYAFEAGERLLHQIKAPGANLLNWYVEAEVGS